MPLRYKINILNALKEKGYNTNRIRTEGLFSQSTLQKLREGKGLSWEYLRIVGTSTGRLDRIRSRKQLIS